MQSQKLEVHFFSEKYKIAVRYSRGVFPKSRVEKGTPWCTGKTRQTFLYQSILFDCYKPVNNVSLPGMFSAIFRSRFGVLIYISTAAICQTFILSTVEEVLNECVQMNIQSDLFIQGDERIGFESQLANDRTRQSK